MVIRATFYDISEVQIANAGFKCRKGVYRFRDWRRLRTWLEANEENVITHKAGDKTFIYNKRRGGFPLIGEIEENRRSLFVDRISAYLKRL